MNLTLWYHRHEHSTLADFFSLPKIRLSACILLSGTTFALCAFFYAAMRGWDTFGFHWTELFALLIIPGILLFFAFFSVLLLFLRDHWYKRLFFLVLAVWFLGTISGEALVSWDEHQFIAEAHAKEPAMAPGQMYVRDRCWPNRSSSLIFKKGAGFSATD